MIASPCSAYSWVQDFIFSINSIRFNKILWNRVISCLHVTVEHELVQLFRNFEVFYSVGESWICQIIQQFPMTNASKNYFYFWKMLSIIKIYARSPAFHSAINFMPLFSSIKFLITDIMSCEVFRTLGHLLFKTKTASFPVLASQSRVIQLNTSIHVKRTLLFACFHVQHVRETKWILQPVSDAS